MQWRPRQARWFETYVPRSHGLQVLQSMAATGVIELESDVQLAQPLGPALLRQSIDAFRELYQSHQDVFDGVPAGSHPLTLPPEQVAEQSLGFLRNWCTAVDKLLLEQLSLERERHSLVLLQEFLQVGQGVCEALPLLGKDSRFLYKGLFACASGHVTESGICSRVDEFVSGMSHDFFLVADLPEQQQTVELCYQDRACQEIAIPEGLPQQPQAQLDWVWCRLQALDQRRLELQAQLSLHRRQPSLAEALDSLRLLTWYLENVDQPFADDQYCHITGWILSDRLDVLDQVLHGVGLDVPVRYTRAPQQFSQPVSLTLPAWASPFQQFIEMAGTPGADEVNPGLLLPLTISLLFGYMFPDVGHGLVLALLSLLLFRRWPQGRFLLPCGISAALFGVVFGEVFGRHDVIEPLWIRPLQEPLLILLPPLLFGAGLLLLGLAFNGVEAHWRRQGPLWWQRDAPVLLIYTGVVLGTIWPPFWWLAVAALAWFVVIQLWASARSGLKLLFTRIAELVQGLFELLLNSLSFVRVGAFALAHAALTSAVLQIGQGVEQPLAKALFLVIGHLLIILIEGMVVYVQTSRLILFEFFIHFLKADGRILRPLSTGNSSSPSAQDGNGPAAN